MRAIKIPASPAGRKTGNIFILFFSLFLTLAVFSQINIAYSKPTSDVGLNKVDWLYFKSNNDLSAYLGKKSSTLPTVRYQKGDDYLQFSMTGVSSTTSISLETDTKTPNTPTLFYRNILDSADVNYQITNIPFKVKEEIVLQSIKSIKSKVESQNTNLSPTTFFFSAETSAKPVKQKDGSIAFFDNQNNYLFQLDKPFMVDGKGIISNDVSIEIKPTSDVGLGWTNKTKIASEETTFDALVGASAGIVNRASSLADRNILSSSLVNIKKVLEARGIEPPRRGLTIPTLHQAAPKTKLFYHKENFNQNRHPMSVLGPKQYTLTLKADSNWLNDPNTTYPVIIDPTVTHNADANFTGQMNRIADNDSTSSTQLESSYPEATNDPYTVLNLHFNEANGTTAGIRDYASTTRVITANGNASTTNYVTQLGMGNAAAFDGTGDYLSIPDSDDWSFGSGDFSIDFWINYAVAKGDADEDTFIFQQLDGNNGFQIYNANDEAIYIFGMNGGSGVVNVHTTSAWNPGINTWHHLAFIRNGTNMLIFIDGVIQPLTVTISPGTNDFGNISAAFGIASRLDAGTQNFNGYLDSLRIIKGRALTPEEIKATASRRPYAVYTSPVLDATASVQWDTVNWTEGGVKTGDGETLYNSSGLVAQWNFNETSGTTADNAEGTAALDGTLNGFSYTASQDQATTTTGWTANNKKWGAGSLMFDGTNDYVSVADNAGFSFGTGNFTIETWMNFSVLQNAHFFNQYADGSNYWKIYFNNADKLLNFGALTSGGMVVDVDAPWSPNTNVWYHIVLVRSGSTESANDWNLFVNGKALTLTKSGGLWANSWGDYAGGINIGRWGGGSYLLNGILDSTRIIKGRALSASEILSNYNAGNIEIQTRTGATSDPNDGTWEAWKPTTSETQLLSMDSDAVNWHSDIMASTTIATSTETVIKAEGTGSLKIRTGMASTTAGTVALWHFEETGTTTGTYLYDETANNNDATTTGTTVVDGIFGKARKFNGTSDYVSVPDSANFDLDAGDFTIDLWVNPSSYSSGDLMGKRTAGGSNWVLFYLNGGNQNYEFYASSNGSTWDMVNSGSLGSVDINTWTHLAAVRSGNNFTFYKNGIVKGTASSAGTVLAGAQILRIGTDGGSQFINGLIDEPRILKGRALSADEIAETYRMGANHHLTRQVSATDLSAQTKLAFWIAADRPGTGLEAMIGESDYANYELASSTLALSTTTVLYIKGDEIASSTSIKDSSFSGKAITANGNARTSGGGKIGNAVYFDGTGDYLSLADSDDWSLGTAGNGNYTIDFWTKWISLGSVTYAQVENGPQTDGWELRYKNSTNVMQLLAHGVEGAQVAWTPMVNAWYHVALVRSGSIVTLYIDGVSKGTFTDIDMTNNGYALTIGAGNNGTQPLNGNLDEVRVIKGTALTADQIRQAYEYGLRTHPITIDFGATLQTSDLISSATDYNFSITATTSGLSATTSGLYLGDTIIVKENRGGTESVAQGVVKSINSSTGAVIVASWSGSAPSGGFTVNATIFKWQREYFDITGSLSTHRDAITNLTLRPTNGAEGRTIYLDDFRYNTNYLTASSSSAITSGNKRYLQYRAIFTSTDSFVSPFLSAFNTLYTALANSFPSLIGISGGGFLSF